MAAFMKEGDFVSLDKDIKNKWLWSWLDQLGDSEIPHREWVRKVASPGVCICTMCNKFIKYGSNGSRALVTHSKTSIHKEKYRGLCYLLLICVD